MLLSRLRWPQVEQLSRDLPVLIPIAAVEQHGHHLPLNTDSLLLGEVVRRVEENMTADVLILPQQWLGNSHHHLDFPGTLSAEPRVYLNLLSSLVENMIQHGFRRLFLLNGHGGNDVPGKQVTFEMRQKYRQRHDLLLLFSTYWTLGKSPKEELVDLYQTDMGHACEWETSMMLHLAPELVEDYANIKPVEPGNSFRPANRAWITKERSHLGHIGWPHVATPEKGQSLFDKFSNDVSQMLQRIGQWNGESWEG